MTEKRFTSFIEDDGYWIRDESDFKIITTGLKFGVAENLIAMLNGLTAKNKVLYKEIERLKRQNKDLLYSNAKNMELLEKENGQLKADNNRLVNETAKIVAEHQGKVLELIDKRIDKCEPIDYARNIEGDVPVFDCETATEIRVLNELKKELSE